MEGFTVGLFADVAVSRSGPGYPYEPVERLTRLIENTGRLREVDSIVVESTNNETVCRAVLEGTELEYVYSATALKTTRRPKPRTRRGGRHPRELFGLRPRRPPQRRPVRPRVVDDRVGICRHGAETGVLTAVVDTSVPVARERAVSVFERYRREARPVELDALDALISPEFTARGLPGESTDISVLGAATFVRSTGDTYS